MVSVDAIYDDKNAGLKDLLIPSTIPAGDTHQQNVELHGKNSQLGLRIGEGSGAQAVFAMDLFGSIDGYELRVRDFYFEYGALRAGYGYTAKQCHLCPPDRGALAGPASHPGVGRCQSGSV